MTSLLSVTVQREDSHVPRIPEFISKRVSFPLKQRPALWGGIPAVFASLWPFHLLSLSLSFMLFLWFSKFCLCLNYILLLGLVLSPILFFLFARSLRFTFSYFVYPSTYLFIYLFFDLSACLSFHLSRNLSYLSIYLAICLYVFRSLSLSPFHLWISLSPLCLCISLSIYLHVIICKNNFARNTFVKRVWKWHKGSAIFDHLC